MHSPTPSCQISLISHEANEAITDWDGAWADSASFENVKERDAKAAEKHQQEHGDEQAERLPAKAEVRRPHQRGPPSPYAKRNGLGMLRLGPSRGEEQWAMLRRWLEESRVAR